MIQLLREHSRRILELVGSLLDRSTLRSVDDGRGPLRLMGARHAWNDLDAEGRQTQSRLLNDLDNYTPLVEVFVRVAPVSVRSSVENANTTLREIADRSGLTWYRTAQEARDAAEKAIETKLEALESLDDSSDGRPIYVPDANALLWNPDLDHWSFADSSKFEVVLAPSVIGELDELKMRENLRERTEAILGRIKDYRRRGAIREGVTLRAGRSTIRMIAAEPDFAQTLSWLDASNKDDRYLASTIEIMRRHPRCPVALVTRDGNLQNKAELAGVPFVEPPEPSETTKARATQARKPSGRSHDIRILEIRPTGGSDRSVDFVAEVQNYGTQPVRAQIRATIGDEEMECLPAKLDLLVNQPPQTVRLLVPRPRLGDLAPALNSATTLYGGTLLLEIVSGEQRVSESWSEPVYDPVTDQARSEAQQRAWRRGGGEETEDDLLAEARHRMKNDPDSVRREVFKFDDPRYYDRS